MALIFRKEKFLEEKRKGLTLCSVPPLVLDHLDGKEVTPIGDGLCLLDGIYTLKESWCEEVDP